MALSGSVCLVTGASRGIGRGIALQLSEAGATVYITGRQEKTLRQTASEVGHFCIFTDPYKGAGELRFILQFA